MALMKLLIPRMRLLKRGLILAVCCLHSQAGGAEQLPVLAGPPIPDEQRFSFVVHGDLTGGERPGIFAAAAAQIAMLQPDFVISVGDLIEGDGEDAAALNQEWEAYETRATAMTSTVYLVGGNHDLTSELQREVWRDRYGPTYYHFRYGDALFLVLDTEDYSEERRSEIARARFAAIAVANTQGREAFGKTEYASMPERVTGAIGAEQRDYFLKVLADNEDVRWTFLFMHKSAWESELSENFGVLEDAMADRPYAVFHGHEHAQRYQQRLGRSYVRLATTGGVQSPEKGRSVDHLTLVTVGERVSVATLDLAGIRDASGHLPDGADELCFDTRRCDE